MVPRDIALLNLVRSLDDDVESGLYDRPRVVHLASRMSDPDVASMAVHSQNETVIEVAQAELKRRGRDSNGDPIPPPMKAEDPDEFDLDLSDLNLSETEESEDDDLDFDLVL